MCLGLTEADTSRLREACDRDGLDLRGFDESNPVRLDDDLLAVFLKGPDLGLSPASIREHGAYAVEVHDALSAKDVLYAMRGGHHFVVTLPLDVDRLTAFLAYLHEVAPPPRSQILTLDQRVGTLSTGGASSPITPAAFAVLRLLGEHPDRIVPREDLMALEGVDDPRSVMQDLRRLFDTVGSPAQILNVPHLGYRLVGRVNLIVG